MADATKKGTETMLGNFRRCLLSSSEAANTIYVEGHSDAKSGINFFSKTRLCEWTLDESLATATGAVR